MLIPSAISVVIGSDILSDYIRIPMINKSLAI